MVIVAFPYPNCFCGKMYFKAYAYYDCPNNFTKALFKY